MERKGRESLDILLAPQVGHGYKPDGGAELGDCAWCGAPVWISRFFVGLIRKRRDRARVALICCCCMTPKRNRHFLKDMHKSGRLSRPPWVKRWKPAGVEG